jgi:uncharacterized protein YbcV (DUF1398 family)
MSFSNFRQPLDELMETHGVANADLVRASTQQLTFKNVHHGRTGHRITPNIQDKILTALSRVKPELKLRRRDLFHYEMEEDMVQGIRDARTKVSTQKLDFPQFVDLLDKAGVNRYSVEVGAHRIIYYGAASEVHIENGPAVNDVLPAEYNAEAIKAAISASQRRDIDYPTFLKRIHEAGVVSYEVNIRAREIRYRGETMSYKEKIPVTGSAQTLARPAPQAPASPKKEKKKKGPKKIVANSLKRRKAAKRGWRERR